MVSFSRNQQIFSRFSSFEFVLLDQCGGMLSQSFGFELSQNDERIVADEVKTQLQKVRQDAALAKQKVSRENSPKRGSEDPSLVVLILGCFAGSGYLKIYDFYCPCHCCLFIPQQRKLMGSSAQIRSGVCRCGSQEQVPEEGSGRLWRVPVCAGVGSGGGVWKVPEGSGVCWSRFRRQIPEGSGEFRCKMVKVPEASSGGLGRFRRVPESVGSGGRVRKVPESSGVVYCLATLTGAAM